MFFPRRYNSYYYDPFEDFFGDFIPMAPPSRRGVFGGWRDPWGPRWGPRRYVDEGESDDPRLRRRAPERGAQGTAEPPREGPDRPEGAEERHGQLRPYSTSLSPFFSRWHDSVGEMIRGAFSDAAEMMTAEPKGGEGSRVYCSSSRSIIRPDGSREVVETSRDSTTGKEITVRTREIGETRVTERVERDMKSGSEVRTRDLVGLEAEDAATFDAKWDGRALAPAPCTSGENSSCCEGKCMERSEPDKKEKSME